MAQTDRIAELLQAWQAVRAAGRELSPNDLCPDRPELAAELDRHLQAVEQLSRSLPTPLQAADTVGPRVSQPSLGRQNSLSQQQVFTESPRTIGGFVILRLLGEGGMGSVYEARDGQLGRRVALKVMKPWLACDPTARERFLREARAAAALQHDHVVPIFHVGDDGAAPFIVMPLLTGESLESRLKRERMLPIDDVIRIGRETASGLAAAHAAGVIHRDIKPGNLWLEAPGGRVRILDFGLARAMESTDAITQAGIVLGTANYMSPEQAEGRQVDARSDLFSLGCVLYRAATGHCPFQGETFVAALRAAVEHDPTPPAEFNPRIPAELSDLIMRLLGKDPHQRPTTAESVADLMASAAAKRTDLTPSVQLAATRLQSQTRFNASPAIAADRTVPDAGVALPDPSPEGKAMRAVLGAIRHRMISGMLAVLPLVLTIVVLRFLYQLAREWIITPLAAAVSNQAHSREIPVWFEEYTAPVVAVALIVVGLYVAGVIAETRLLALIDRMMLQAPVVKVIYKSLRNVVYTLLQQDENAASFKRVVLVKFPHSEARTPGFVTATLTDPASGKTILAVYIPTTPLPSSGHMMLVPEDEVTDLSWTVDETLQAIISGGMKAPKLVDYSAGGGKGIEN